MSRRNVAWLVVVIGVGVLVWIMAGLVWGLLAAAVTLICSELIERARRKSGARHTARPGVRHSPTR